MAGRADRAGSVSATPVSDAAAAAALRKARAKGVAVWLDAAGTWTPVADRLADEAEVPVVRFRGSLLELVMALGEHAADADPGPLIVHLPGFNATNVTDSPALEVYRLGTRHEPALAKTLTDAAAGRVDPDALAELAGRRDLTLAEADAWLAGELARLSGGLAARLAELELGELVARLLGESAITGFDPGDADSHRCLWEHLHRQMGLTGAWRAELLGEDSLPGARRIGEIAAGFALCVEYVHDLKRAAVVPSLRPLSDLSDHVVAACTDLARGLRKSQPDVYVGLADGFDTLLAAEIAAAQPSDLGAVDTFRFEEACLRRGAIRALERGKWDEALSWAAERGEAGAFWAERVDGAAEEWALVEAAARLGQAIASAGRPLAGVQSLDEAARSYVDRVWEVDLYHRQLEQERTRHWSHRLPNRAALAPRLDEIEHRYAAWAGRLALDLSAVYRSAGFLPDARLQQRHVFEQVIQPLVRDAEGVGPVALLLVDALRYEMAEELRTRLGEGTRASIELEARLSELPSDTPVCMNALAPVARAGRLAAVVRDGKIVGFSTGEFQVVGRGDRRKAMQARVGGATCPLFELRELGRKDAASLRRSIGRSRLVVVTSTSLDKAGHDGLGASTYADLLRDIRGACHLLHEAGVSRIVVTSDHGFLLVPPSVDRRGFGKRTEPKDRHVYYPQPAAGPGLLSASLESLGYEGASGHVVFRDDAGVFDTGGAAPEVVHGGCSLQERLVPVLTIVHPSKRGSVTQRYELDARALPGEAGAHSLKVRVRPSRQLAMGFEGPNRVELALEAVDETGVRVQLLDAGGAASVAGGSFFVPVDRDGEVRFRLVGDAEARVRVRVYHPTAVQQVEAVELAERFDVVGRRPSRRGEPPSAESAKGWLGELEDERVRRVFEHLEEYGAVTEQEATDMLGSPRAFRRLSRRWDALAARAPFRVRIETTASGKRYVREGG